MLARAWMLNSCFKQRRGEWLGSQVNICGRIQKTTAIKDTPKCGGAEWNKTQARNKPFHLKAVHFSNHKTWVPVASERIWAFNAFLPFIHGTDDFIQDDTPLQQFRGLAGQAYERRGFLLKQRAEV